MQYELILKNEKTKYYKVIRDLVAVFNLIGFVYLLKKTTDSFDKYFYFLFIVVTALYLILVLVEHFFKKIIADKFHRFIFLWSAIGWARSAYWWISFILIVFLFLDILAQRKMILTIGENIIKFPSVPSREIEWSELTNLVLKDGLITIDFKNNKIIQQTVFNTEISEREFNDFCRLQLNK